MQFSGLNKYKLKYGFSIPVETAIGKGLYIGHFGSIAINPKAVIGENCNISPGNTIRQTNRGKKQGVPTIGNKVWIGTNAIIVGQITIGDNALIAPGAIVNFVVPEYDIVLGYPGKIVSYNGTEGYINRVLSI
ncbi:serine acetyltransferase [Candidatus Omnitrophus magneticus]|uniref:Serine acetyltransferase n=1 Tax=Candidatus Omnitrophus magneticus TaxID=1609969 RepID=A0A0F0CJL8_9BACT|nr:serine acetyltransferase [Candidatus Omnitrophus magneticus]